MTALAPASASISAEISPVWAPDASGWQSCAADRESPSPAHWRQRCMIRVAGGQISRSTLRQQIRDARRSSWPTPRRCLEAVHLPVAGDQRPNGLRHEVTLVDTGSPCGELAFADNFFPCEIRCVWGRTPSIPMRSTWRGVGRCPPTKDAGSLRVAPCRCQRRGH